MRQNSECVSTKIFPFYCQVLKGDGFLILNECWKSMEKLNNYRDNFSNESACRRGIYRRSNVTNHYTQKYIIKVQSKLDMQVKQVNISNHVF